MLQPKLSKSSQSKWSAIANSILAQTGDEKKAEQMASLKTKPSVRK